MNNNASGTHTGNANHYSGVVFSSISMNSGSGNLNEGYARITNTSLIGAY